MRNPKRIQTFCDRLARAWSNVPDWRFGQLIINVLGEMERDPFFPEDDEMIKFIEGYFERHMGASVKDRNAHHQE